MRRLIPIALLVLSLAPAAAGADEVVRIPIAFDVTNTNDSALDCSSDDLDYRIRGEVVGPASLLRRPSIPVATLYLHEFSFGRFFWQFRDVPGYDHVGALAREGHASIVIDRLGYDDSGHPPGSSTCLGAQADVVAQVVRQLREGTAGVTVERLVLAGHSVGGGVAELAAHSFPELDIAGLMLFGWADQGYSSRTVEQSARQSLDCRTRSEPAEPGEPTGYAYFGRTEAEFQANVFSDTDPEVVERATARRNRDPCGDNATVASIAVVNQMGVKKITAPVLLVFGEKDAVFRSGTMESQAELFEGSSKVTTQAVPGAGHALTLERSAPMVRQTTAAWLTASGLAPAPVRRPTSGPGPTTTVAGDSARDPQALPAVEGRPASESAESEGGSLPVTGAGTPRAAAPLLSAALVLGYVLSRARRSTSSTIGTISAGGLLPRKARNSGMAAAASFLSWKRIMPLKKRASG